MHIHKRHTTVFLEISSARFVMSAFDGEARIAHHDARPDVSADGVEWRELLQQFEAELTDWVRAQGLGGLQATVVYAGPETTALINSCPSKAGTRRATLAARMALADTVPFALDGNPYTTQTVFRDREASGGVAPKAHTLAVADVESTISSIIEAVERAGLHADECVPAISACMIAAVRAAADCASDTAPGVVLWIGDQSSGVAAIESGRLAFARLVPVGIETLVEALARPVASQHEKATPIIDPESGRCLLLRAGIPGPDGWSDGAVDLDFRVVLSLLQPVLQRLVVELKQSIRFGLAAETREHATLTLAGAGAQIRGLAETLQQGLGCPVVLGTLAGAPESDASDIETVRHLGDASARLVTSGVAESRTARSTARAILVGGLIGVLAVAMDATHSWMQLRATNAALAAIDAQPPQAHAAGALTPETAMATQLGVSSAEQRIAANFPEAAPLGAVLLALGSMTPEAVSLQSIEFREAGGGVECVIMGDVVGEADDSEIARLRRYTDALRECPLISDTQLGETRRVLGEDIQKLSFGITLRLVTLPTSSRPFAAASEGGGQNER